MFTVLCVCVRDALSGGKDHLAVRGIMEVGIGVAGMVWDGAAMDGVALTTDGSIWYELGWG